MIKVEHIDVWGIIHAMRGMRNPLDSWDKGDTKDGEIGDNDASLAHRLFAAGTEHRKYMRQMYVSMDITAPRYWYTEFDTYKISTTSNSCSTMHTIHKRPFTKDDFSHEHLSMTAESYLSSIIGTLNANRELYLETKDKSYWWNIIQLLPQSYNQKRTVTMSYETAYNMIRQRKEHKLNEWREFVDILMKLPYMGDFVNGR